MNYKHFITLAVLISMMFSKVMAEKYLPVYADKKLMFSGPDFFEYFNGDTTINTKKFIKVYRGDRSYELFSRSGGDNPALHSNLDSVIRKNIREVSYLVSEDTITRKIYKIRELGKNNEEEVFDLSIDPFQGLSLFTSLANIRQGSISAYGVTRRAIIGNCCNATGDYLLQGGIEGIGVVGYAGSCGGPPEWAQQSTKYILFRDGRFESYTKSMLHNLGVENESDRKNFELVDFVINNSQLTFTLCGEHASVPAQCKVYGANGSVVFNGQIGSTPQTVSTASLSPGIYLAVVTTSAGEVLGRHKFVVK